MFIPECGDCAETMLGPDGNKLQCRAFFFKLKLVKNRLRTTMTHNRLNNLSIMSIETDVLRGIQFDQLIETLLAARRSKSQ